MFGPALKMPMAYNRILEFNTGLRLMISAACLLRSCERLLMKSLSPIWLVPSFGPGPGQAARGTWGNKQQMGDLFPAPRLSNKTGFVLKRKKKTLYLSLEITFISMQAMAAESPLP